VRTYLLGRKQIVGAPLDEVFDFFSAARNLEARREALERYRVA
jgi:hypothetical protein